MAGSLTLGGMAAGLPGGNLVFGPSTVAGKAQVGETVNVNLTPNVDFVVQVPSEAVQWAAFFGVTSAAPELKVGSNLVTTANGMPTPAQGFVSAGLVSGVKELKFNAASAPSTFQVVFV